MNSVDLLEEAIQLAIRSGFEVRQEWLNEAGGGACRIGTKRVLFVDLSLTAAEQLDVVAKALRQLDCLDHGFDRSEPLVRLLKLKQTGSGIRREFQEPR